MPSDHEIRAAVKAMLENDPIVIGMMTPHERVEIAIAALSGAEIAREEERMFIKPRY